MFAFTIMRMTGGNGVGIFLNAISKDEAIQNDLL